jgi:hypothetical protein
VSSACYTLHLVVSWLRILRQNRNYNSLTVTVHSKYHCTIAYIKTSLHCRTFNSQLNSLDSSIICQLPTPELSIQLPAATANYLVAISSQSSSTVDSRDSLNYISAGLGSTPKENTASQHFLYCYRGVFTPPLHRNGSSSIVACVFISAGTCLPSRCLAMNVYSGSAIPAFGRHNISEAKIKSSDECFKIS